MFEIISHKTNIDFVSRRHIFVGLSVLAIIVTTVLLFTKGLNYGIDFKGGAEVQVRFTEDMDVGTLRKDLEDAGLKNLTIQALGAAGQAGNREFLAKMGVEDSNLQKVGDKVEQALLAKMPKEKFEIQRVDVVGPQAGEQLRKSGFLSMLYALLCIFIYVAIRFDSRYSPGAVAALVHDTFITLGIYVITQREFSLQILAALLTIIGYSNNDTIIVFDRVRESLRNFPNRSLEENINRSINETLGRTILTSLCTVLVTTALYIFGGGVIRDFAFTMSIGIVVGCYSSVFVASPLLIYITHWQERHGGKAQPSRSFSAAAAKP
jgi:preprotein translocase subunit SecF